MRIFVNLNFISLLQKYLNLIIDLDSSKAGKKGSKMMFKDNMIELNTKLTKENEVTFARKNVS